MALTDAEKNAIHVTLEKTNGDRNAAAQILGLDPLKLKDTIHSCPWLKERWTKQRTVAQALTPSEAYVRPPLPVSQSTSLTSPTEEERKAALENASLRRGLKGLKLSEEEMELAVSLRNFHHRQYAAAADFVSGGAATMALKILSQISELEERLRHGFSGENALAEEKMVRDSLHRFMEQYTKIKDRVDEATFKKALIELKKKESNSPKRGKPGFAPLQAQQTKIEIHLDGDKKPVTSEVPPLP